MVKKILVSQPAPTSEKSPYFEIAEKLGIEFVFHPLIKVECLSAKEFRQQKVQILDHSAIVFNSRNAIDHFFTLCKEMRVTIPEDMKYFGLSESIALYIQKYVQYRKRKVFFGTTGKWPELVAVMGRTARDVKEEEAEALGHTLEERFPDVELNVHPGGQPIYSFLIGVQ